MMSFCTNTLGRLALLFGLCFAASVGAQTQPVNTYSIVSLLDYSGPFANRGKPVEQMQRLVVDWYNETRGLASGVKLDFKPVDTGYDQGKTVQAYERALQDKSLIGVVTFGSPNIIAIQSRLPNDKIPAVHGGPAYSMMKPGSWVFTPLNDFSRHYSTALKWRLGSWKENRPLKVAFVTFDGSSGRDWAQGFQNLTKGMNAQLVLTEYVSPRAIDVSSNVAHILEANPDMVFLATTDQLQPAILKELKDSKFDMGKIVNSQHEGLGLLEMLGLAKDVYEGTYEVTTQNYTDQTTEAYKTYQSRQSKYATRWAGDTLMHFTSLMVMIDAIDRAQAKAGKAPISGASVHAEMRSGTFKGYGLLNNIKFDSENDPTLGADSVIMLRQLGGKVAKASDFLPLVK